MAAVLTTSGSLAAPPADGRAASRSRRRGGPLRRRHGASVPFDRDELERSGWRTTLDYHENHVRRRDGRLDQLEAVWHATGERIGPDGAMQVVTARAHTATEAWSRLRHEADLAACGPPSRSSREAPTRARRQHANP